MNTRGLRGATTVTENKRELIIAATKELLLKISDENKLVIEDIAAIHFSLTHDLNAEFPAVAARELGWNDTPLLCMSEINVPKSLPRCIRVLLLINTDKSAKEIKHIYLRDAVGLRR